jgi:co-chaperonin GroES (HSP10)
MKLKSPANKLIVYPKSRFAKNISDLMKRASIENGATVDPSDCVNITGEIISLPDYISPTNDYKGFSTKDLKVGDVAIFSFRVIYDYVIKKEGEEPVLKNSIVTNDKEYFLCDIRHVFGVIRDGQIIMVNGWVMLDEFEPSKIILSASLKKQKNATASRILYIGSSRTHLKKIDAQPGDMVFYNSMKAQHYQINDKKFIILPQNLILGKDLSNTE